VDVLISFAQIELLSIASHPPPYVLKQDWRDFKGSQSLLKHALLLKGRVVDRFYKHSF
jgi:hypothetical protein